MLCNKLPRNWRIEKTLLSEGKIEKLRTLTELPTQQYQESRTMSLSGDQRWRLQEWLESMETSIFSTILTYWAVMTVPTFLIKLLLPRVQKKKAQPRSWNAAKHTREYEYPWKRFWSSTCSKWVPDDFYNNSRNLLTPSRINNDVEDPEKRNWAMWERRTIAINTFYLAFQ